MPRRSWLRRITPAMALLTMAAALGGCVAYPAPYGYYPGPYAYAPAPAVGVYWGGGWHRHWHDWR